MRYGDWTGGELKKLAKDPLWKVVQAHPSAMTFPGEGGEAMRDMQTRAVDAVREWNQRHGPDAVYVVVSHGDVIKAVLADALGMHLDQFQRIEVDPCVGQRRHATRRCARSSCGPTTSAATWASWCRAKKRSGRKRRPAPTQPSAAAPAPRRHPATT